MYFWAMHVIICVALNILMKGAPFEVRTLNIICLCITHASHTQF